MQPARPRPNVKTLIKVAVSVSLLLALVLMTDVYAVGRAMLSVGPLLWVGSLGLYLAGHVISAQKWRRLAAPELSRFHSLRAHFSGLAANLALPGAASGDIVRAGVAMQSGRERALIAVGSLADRIIDTFGLLILAFAGWLLATPLADHVAWPAVLAGSCILGVVLFLLAKPCTQGALRFFERRSGKVSGLIAKMLKSVLALLGSPIQLLTCLAISLFVQGLFIGISATIGMAAGINVSLFVWVFAWPLSKLVATLPISMGGIGIREASLAGLMVPFGADPALVVASGLVWQSIVIVGALLGMAMISFTSAGIGKPGEQNGDM